jgi:hypothetical protein
MDENEDMNKSPVSQNRGEDIQASGEKKYIVKHNKSNVELTLDELIKNAEKGLDYDRIRPSHDFVKELAAKSGENDVSRFIAKMRNEYDGDTPAVDISQPKRDIMDNAHEMEMIAEEYPEYIKNGKLELPEDVALLHKGGLDVLNACRFADLKRTKELCEKLSALLEAQKANAANAAASIGSLSGGCTPEKDFYTSQEWDKLPQKSKEKFIKNGKIYEFMKKWSGK